jgi:hypothetical protein
MSSDFYITSLCSQYHHTSCFAPILSFGSKRKKRSFLCSIEVEEFLLSNHFSLLSGWGEITRLVFRAKASMGL